jgi:hypothetical protein
MVHALVDLVDKNTSRSSVSTIMHTLLLRDRPRIEIYRVNPDPRSNWHCKLQRQLRSIAGFNAKRLPSEAEGAAGSLDVAIASRYAHIAKL